MVQKQEGFVFLLQHIDCTALKFAGQMFFILIQNLWNRRYFPSGCCLYFRIYSNSERVKLQKMFYFKLLKYFQSDPCGTVMKIQADMQFKFFNIWHVFYMTSNKTCKSQNLSTLAYFKSWRECRRSITSILRLDKRQLYLLDVKDV